MRDPDDVGDIDGVTLLVFAWEPLGVGVKVGVGEVVSLGDIICEPVRLQVAEALPAWETDAVVVAVVVAGALPPCEGVAVAVADTLAVEACERDPLWVADGVAPCEVLDEALGV